MTKKKSIKEKGAKAQLHPRNRHTGRYDFGRLIKSCPELRSFVIKNKFGNTTIDFANAAAVKCLNRALLFDFYNLDYWEFPEGNLCPPVPGRADMIHALADILARDNKGKVPRGESVRVLDIGVGANAIYPIIGSQEYGWNFVASDIDEKSLKSVRNIVDKNAGLRGKVECRFQKSSEYIFTGVIQEGDYFTLTLCNPPFHSSAKEAAAGTARKLKNLGTNRGGKKSDRNFSGKSNELWCRGGEKRFIKQMATESLDFSQQCSWFSTLVSKGENLSGFYKILKDIGAQKVETIDMNQGQKVSRVVAWSFLNDEKRANLGKY